MYNRWTDGETDGHMDSQSDTIIPHHYRVAGFKNVVCYSWHFKG